MLFSRYALTCLIRRRSYILIEVTIADIGLKLNASIGPPFLHVLYVFVCFVCFVSFFLMFCVFFICFFLCVRVSDKIGQLLFFNELVY